MLTDLRFTMTHEHFSDPTIGKCSCVIDAWLRDCGSASKALKSILAWVLICSEWFWACWQRKNEGFKTGLRVPHISMLLTELFTNYWWKMCIETVNVGGGRLKHRNIRRSETRFKAPIRAVLTRPEPHKTVQNSSINGENHVKTGNIGKGHCKHRDITRSWTRFKALICAVLTSPESHKTVHNSWINGEKSM